jgi:hypothetical protein
MNAHRPAVQRTTCAQASGGGHRCSSAAGVELVFREFVTQNVLYLDHVLKLPLESFPFKRQPGVAQRQIRAFAELDFIAKAENIVLIGPTGVGKTGLATGLLLKALQNGYRGLFLRAQDLFDEVARRSRLVTRWAMSGLSTSFYPAIRARRIHSIIAG